MEVPILGWMSFFHTVRDTILWLQTMTDIEGKLRNLKLGLLD